MNTKEHRHHRPYFDPFRADSPRFHRHHITLDLIGVQDKQFSGGQQQCITQSTFYALKPAMQPAFMDLFSSISGFFIGRRHQLVQSLPFFIAIAFISTSTLPALLVHRHHRTLDLIGVQGQEPARQQQCATQNTFYALKSIM